METDTGPNVLKSTLEEVQSRSSGRKLPSDPCVVCLEPISERAVASPCNHCSFDFLCLVSWLQESSTCPLCKSGIRAVEYDWRSPEQYETYKVPKPIESSSSVSSIYHDPRSTVRYDRHRPLRHVRRTPQPSVPVSANAALLRRRKVYQQQLYSLHVGSNRLSRFRELTPQRFAQDEELVSRARKWIRRELQVFDHLKTGDERIGTSKQANNEEFLLEYIIAILRTVNIKGSGGQAEDMLSDFLGAENTRLFIHELRAWLRSPYIALEDWDRNVQYDKPLEASPERRKLRAAADGRPPRN